jgi:hypothetical protein
MDMFSEVLGSLIAVCGVGVFGYLYFASRRRMDEEHGLQPIYYEQCGGSFGGGGLTPPFVRLAIYDRFVVVAIGGTRYLLRAGDIQGTLPKWHPLWKGVRIDHRRADVPSSFIVWSRHPDKVIEAINRVMTTIRPT